MPVTVSPMSAIGRRSVWDHFNILVWDRSAVSRGSFFLYGNQALEEGKCNKEVRSHKLLYEALLFAISVKKNSSWFELNHNTQQLNIDNVIPMVGDPCQNLCQGSSTEVPNCRSNFSSFEIHGLPTTENGNQLDQ